MGFFGWVFLGGFFSANPACNYQNLALFEYLLMETWRGCRDSITAFRMCDSTANFFRVNLQKRPVLYPSSNHFVGGWGWGGGAYLQRQQKAMVRTRMKSTPPAAAPIRTVSSSSPLPSPEGKNKTFLFCEFIKKIQFWISPDAMLCTRW